MRLHKSWGYALIVFGLVMLTSSVSKMIHLDELVAAKVEAGVERIGSNMERFGEEMDRFGASMEKLAEGFSDGNLVIEMGSQTIELEQIKKIKLENNVGQIKVTADANAKQATLKYTKKLNTNEPRQEAQERLKQVTIDVHEAGEATMLVQSGRYLSDSLLKQFRVDYELVVPPAIAIELDTKVGDITTSGLQSDLTVIANVAKIDIDGFKGTLHVKNNTGAISIQGGKEVKAIEVTSNVGALKLALSEKENLKVDAKTNVGALDSEFSLNERRLGPSKSVQGQIGDGSTGQVTLSTNTGSISLVKSK
ncbi:DUF4097 family beta strand repeat-containing protein [Tumebacillus lipolyticus]|uniref:DUF4097 family beta strand repeat-containing protein n=1 Tax=Tumebacillus lipolyticus TaxID=1280370 RepID=A0ABW4ZV05_9BACL